MLSMYVTNAKFLRTRLAAMLAVAWLVALVVFASCGGDQASPPAATQVPDDPRAAAGQPPAPEPPVILPATLAKADAPDLEPTSPPEPEPTLHPSSVALREPAATPTPTPAPTQTLAPNPTPTMPPTPTSSPTATPTLTPVPAPPIGGLDDAVTRRDMEYDHAVELPDTWRQEWTGRYGSASPWGRLDISSQYLPSGYTLDQFAQLVLYGLRQDWWPNASLFEVTSVEEVLTGDQPGRRIRYRVQEAPQYCVVDVDELVAVFQTLPGNPQGFRARAWICEHDVAAHGPARERILDSFRITTRPAAYYRQFMSARGVTVKADGTVDPAAVEAGAEMVATMLSGREDIARCMVGKRAELAIIPRDRTLTSLPDYAHLKGTRDFTGRSRDTFDIRGVGAVPGLPVSSAGEEQVLGSRGPEHPYYPYRGWVAVHEIAHGIQNLCFRVEDHEEWERFYAEAVQAGVYPGTHMMANVMEFFAVFTTVYFEVTDELDPVNDRETLKNRFPEVFVALDEIYGGGILPEEYRKRLERRQ